MKNNLQINGLKRVFNRFSLAFGLVALLGSFAYGQQVISGKVSDVESGGGLPGVSIQKLIHRCPPLARQVL